MEPSVFILILNWNGWKDTLNCLESIQQLTYSNYRAVVIDNGSSNGSIGEIRSWVTKAPSGSMVLFEYDQDTAISGGDPEMEAQINELQSRHSVVLIRNNDNLGYSGGNNVGIRYALEQNADYIWVLNNDTEVAPDSVSKLIEDAKQKSSIGIWGSTIIDYYSRNSIQCAGGARYMPLLSINRYAMQGLDLTTALHKTKTPNINYPSGASMFIAADVLRRIGLLNEEHFSYYEEVDLATRCRKAGYDIGWCKQSRVFHKEGASLGSNSSDVRQKSLKSEYFSNLSALIYTKNHHRHILPAVFIIRFVLKSSLFMMKHDIRLFKPLFQAYRDFLKKEYQRIAFR